jgi:hypothetical protein
MFRKSKYRGVCWDSARNKWECKITKDGVIYKLGRYTSETEAFKAYQKKFKQLNGYSYLHLEPIFDYENKAVKLPINTKYSHNVLNIKWVTVDLIVYEKIKHIVWSTGTRNYVHGRVDRGNGVIKRTTLHRFIMDFPCGIIDHINSNPLDNRLSNLRVVTTHENNYNRSKTIGNTTSIYKGVSLAKASKRFMAGIQHNGKAINLGYFKSEENAAQAYNFAADKLFGEFAKYNKHYSYE